MHCRLMTIGSVIGSILKDGNPFTISTLMFASAIAGQGTPEQQATWLPRALNHKILGTYAQVSANVTELNWLYATGFSSLVQLIRKFPPFVWSIEFHNYFNACIMHRLLFLFQPTNAQIYVTTVSLYLLYTPTCFDVSLSSSGSFTFLPH